jgi:hypothetical protein
MRGAYMRGYREGRMGSMAMPDKDVADLERAKAEGAREAITRIRKAIDRAKGRDDWGDFVEPVLDDILDLEWGRWSEPK